MGNHRFRLSDMIPNAWFYKLRDMGRLKNHKISDPTNKKLHAPPSSSSSSSSSSFAAQPEQYPSQITKLPHLSDQRKSYYFTRDLTFHPNSPVKTKISASDEHDLVRAEPPRRSSRRRKSTKRSRVHNRAAPPRPVSSSISAGCSCRATLESVWTKPPESSLNSPTDQTSSSTEHGSTLTEYGSDRGLTPDDVMLTSSACKCRAGDDAVINVDANNHPINGHDEFARVSDFDHRHDLPPIITRKQNHQPQEKHQHRPTPVNAVGEKHFSSATVRKASANSSSPGVKLRTNTPKIAKRRGRKSASTETFAVVKSSKDPGRDFRESMVEMIVENNIRASKDLEELLACYLSLNSDEYHELIINVFKQIWFDFIRFRLN